LFHAISGTKAEDSGAVRKFAIDNGNCDSKYADRLPDMQENRACFSELQSRELEEATALPFPAMSEAESETSNPSKYDFRKFW
jgi:hypothetical protein